MFMSLAVRINLENQQKASYKIDELQNKRQEVWSMYCHIAELMPFSAEHKLTEKLLQLCETLIDYVSLGHFGVCESIFTSADRQNPILLAAKDIYTEFSATTETAILFNDKYEYNVDLVVFDGLKQDLSGLGESLAKRFELEDRLCELLLKLEKITGPKTIDFSPGP